MKPVAPVTRQTSSRDGSTARAAEAAPSRRPGHTAGVSRRRSVAVAMSRTTAQFLPAAPWQSASTASSASRKLRASGSESVSGGSSLITSFLPAAIVITPWSRCSGITISCGKSPSLAMWIRRQLSRATRELGALQLDPDHEPAAAHLLDHLVALLQLGEPVEQHGAHARGVLDQAVALDDAQRRQARRHREAIAPVRRLVHVGALERSDGLLVDLAARDHRGDRHVAAAERLADEHEVRLEPPVLEREPPAGAPEPGLDLVDDEQRAVAPAQLLRGLQIARGRERHHAALDRLDDEGGDILRAQLAPPGARGRRTERARSRAAAGRSPP